MAPRGRRRSFDRDAALTTATLLFWERGYEGTSVADLTQAIGINPPSLYAAFTDKRHLFDEVVRAYGHTFGAFLGDALREPATAHEAFTRMLREAAVEYTDPSHPAGCLVISAATNVPPASADVQQTLREQRNNNVRAFEHRLRDAVRDGELPDGTDVRALAVYYATVIQGMSQQARDGASRHDLRRVAELAMRAWPTTPVDGPAPDRAPPQSPSRI
ncbi:TetR/AcrR family transcriptional regulator [Solwaraspora sp. WMMD791]|uniref:TetR/AcrR family transcriptional regulator n=1 Tax=Solwaraspora sp. WMMD791 TaxID=3016086 RepID=UPI00249B50BC|nr:TetR/AcrR family transcriptional regulator [Solwaraspora sp. WMMD791]WFE28326.1 TetR/AcrR family transcriptional regulator [Solwaraspora sp. WMMD791]